MSQENVDLVRRRLNMIADAIRDHEFPGDEAGEILDPEIRLDVSRRVFNPHVYEGIDGLREMIEGIWEVWDEFELRPTEFLGGGDKVVVLLEERGRPRNGPETTREIAYLYTVRAGRVTEWVGGMDPAEALDTLRAIELRE